MSSGAIIHSLWEWFSVPFFLLLLKPFFFFFLLQFGADAVESSVKAAYRPLQNYVEPQLATFGNQQLDKVCIGLSYLGNPGRTGPLSRLQIQQNCSIHYGDTRINV